ncbi:hypothetical protein NMG60_11034073 [Bertholletia excelsa]
MDIQQLEQMDTLIQGYRCSGSTNGFQFAQKLIPSSSPDQEPGGDGSKHGDPDPINSLQASTSSIYSEVGFQEYDFSSETLKYLNQMLMEEEDLEHRPCMFQECLALQAAEKSFYDVLVDAQNQDNSSVTQSSHVNYDIAPILQPPGLSKSSSVSSTGTDDSVLAPLQVPDSALLADKNGSETLPNGSRGKKNNRQDGGDYAEYGRSNKQFAAYYEETEEQSEYDKVLLCAINPYLHEDSELNTDDDALHCNATSKPNRTVRSGGGRPRGKKKGQTKDVVDLRTLLMQCAQAVVSNDGRAAGELLNRIRRHSSPHGDGTERLAHFIGNALEARLGAGAGSARIPVFASGIPAAQVLKGYQVFIQACPFKILSSIFANKSIRNISRKEPRIHIVDFGILYGFQWPCFIQGLAIRPGGPPRLRVTGIDFPHSGFRPSERVEETGRRLAKYCERFKVPFEYHAVAKKWNTIRLEDLKIEKDEMLIVNCLYRLENVPDDIAGVYSPRDVVLNLIKRLNPDLFVHGVLNGTYNAPFFISRFREALFHFSALFDMFDATVPRQDENRVMFEKEVFGRDAMNVIACEGSERLVRPETYRQWQARNVRAGLSQLPLQREIVQYVRSKVRKDYHKDFVVDVDGNWLLQGWKGRILYALSCWRPVQEG